MEIERSVLKNAKYIISFFSKRDYSVTNLKLQKLLYFLEALYMVETNEDHLYNEDFYVWNLGPVSNIVYNEYKFFGKMPIVLEVEIEINRLNEKYITKLHELFKDYNAFTLVNLSHMKVSPWEEISQEYEDGEIPADVKIDKIKTKDLFNTIYK